MSREVLFQPIDQRFVVERLLPYVFGDLEIPHVTQLMNRGVPAAVKLSELRDAYQRLANGEEHYSLQYGRCDPEELLYDLFVPCTLAYCRTVWPHWEGNVYTSIELLPPDSQAVESFAAPITLFRDATSQLPDLGPMLESITDCEVTGGFLSADKVGAVLRTLAHDGLHSPESGSRTFEERATSELIEALVFADRCGLSLVEAVV